MNNKNVILGICGSISAYKSPLLLREFIKSGNNVNCVITEAAKEFVTSAILSNLSKNHVIEDLYDKNFSADGAWHIKLAHSCDLLVIAPCSASTIAKLANGICDNALTTLALALPSDVPIAISPAMDYTMWENKAFQDNLSALAGYGYYILEPETGELSSGLYGKGRLPETSKIFNFCKNILDDLKPENKSEVINESNTDQELLNLKKEISRLKGKSVLITAGPTIEKIDDVRYISNFSSGKMGIALAQEALDRGAKVNLICGPIELQMPEGANVVEINTADEMHSEVNDLQESTDVFIMAAAVSDYKPKYKFEGKIKKVNQPKDKINIELVENPDILKSVGTAKKENQIVAGFALESENELENGRKKLISKNADLIVINKTGKNRAFGSDYNEIKIIDKHTETVFDSMPKSDCAIKIIEKIESKL